MVQIKVLLAVEKGWSSHYRSKHTHTLTQTHLCHELIYAHAASNTSYSDGTARVPCDNLASDPYQGYTICQPEKN